LVAFSAANGNLAAAAGQLDNRIIYNTAAGALLCDADRSRALAAIQFAAHTGPPVISAADFVVAPSKTNRAATFNLASESQPRLTHKSDSMGFSIRFSQAVNGSGRHSDGGHPIGQI
jgi:hypothetical protein